METSEANVHPFVIRIWLEETESEARQAAWRGQITHVPSGKQCSFSHLSDMTAFIAPYLESMDAKTGFWERLRQRLGWVRR